MSGSSIQPRPEGAPRLGDAAGEETAPVDEELPPGGGFMRRLAAGPGGGSGWSAVEIFYDVTREAARQEIQRQRHTGRQGPSATDPPGPDASPGEGWVAASGRRGTPFSGWIVLDPPGPAAPPRSADGAGEEPS